MNNIKRLIFDLDNTLIPWLPEYDKAAFQALKECQLELSIDKINILIKQYEQERIPYSIETMAGYVNELFNTNKGKEFITKWLEYLGKMSVKNSELNKTLEYLSLKYELVVLTNWFYTSQYARMQNAGIDQYFKEIIGGDTHVKPNKESFKQAIGEYSSNECIMIGDSYPIDIEGALKAGLNVIYLSKTDEQFDFPVIKDIQELKEFYKKKERLKMKEKYYITTPIYYPSADFHIGHCYTTIIADSLARYKRLTGYDVFFQTGTDEHGEKIEKKAKEAGVTPKEYVDKIIENAKNLWASLGISYDYFIRTTDEEHEKSVQAIFKKLYEQGDIYKSEYKGLYCVPCESFWTEAQLVDGKCPDCGREVKMVSEEAYFFKLSKYQDKLIKFYDEHPDFILPLSRKNEMLNNFIKPGLEDLCVSRTSFTWGIPVDFDPKHVVYVWVDALSNYITSLGYPNTDSEMFKKYWPADLHLVGKEIVRFHTIIWPCLLMALDLPLPKQVFGHGWLKIDGGKISKSLGNYKDPREYIDAYGVDAVRYYALREVPFGNDGNFSEEALISRTNSDLANTLGNLVNRTISMSHKYFDGIVTNPKVEEELDKELINNVLALKNIVDTKMNELKVNEAIEEIMEVLRSCNKYIDDTTPWSLAKDETKKDRLATVLYNLLESIRICAILLSPFIPTTSGNILKELNTKETSYESISNFGNLELNLQLNEPKILFKRIETK